METGVFDEITTDNFTCYHLVSDVLGNDDERRRKDDQDGVDIKYRSLEVRQSEQGCRSDCFKVHEPETSGGYIADESE